MKRVLTALAACLLGAAVLIGAGTGVANAVTPVPSHLGNDGQCIVTAGALSCVPMSLLGGYPFPVGVTAPVCSLPVVVSVATPCTEDIPGIPAGFGAALGGPQLFCQLGFHRFNNSCVPDGLIGRGVVPVPVNLSPGCGVGCSAGLTPGCGVGCSGPVPGYAVGAPCASCAGAPQVSSGCNAGCGASNNTTIIAAPPEQQEEPDTPAAPAPVQHVPAPAPVQHAPVSPPTEEAPQVQRIPSGPAETGDGSWVG